MDTEHIAIIAVVVLAVVIFGSMFSYGGFSGLGGCGLGMMYGYNNTGASSVGLAFGWIFMILILVSLVLFILWMIKQIQKR